MTPMGAEAALAPFHVHGGRVDAARAAFGGDDWIDLSTGIAPWAWPVGDIPLRFDRLPEPEGIAGLEAAAAAAFAVAPERVVAIPGTDLALRLLATIVPSRTTAVVTPGYAGHCGAWPDAQPLAFEELGRDLGHDLVVLASPANPDGREIDVSMLERLSRSATVVLDQAYADPAPAPTGPRVIALRSFGKFYGLPGLRLGFVVADPAVARRLRDGLGDWPVSSAAVAIGTKAYRDRPWQADQRRRITAAGAALDEILSSAGVAVVGRAPLFRLTVPESGAGLFRHLAGRAILTRPFAAEPDRLRIGLPADAIAGDRLAAALQEYRP